MQYWVGNERMFIFGMREEPDGRTGPPALPCTAVNGTLGSARRDEWMVPSLTGSKMVSGMTYWHVDGQLSMTGAGNKARCKICPNSSEKPLEVVNKHGTYTNCTI